MCIFKFVTYVFHIFCYRIRITQYTCSFFDTLVPEIVQFYIFIFAEGKVNWFLIIRVYFQVLTFEEHQFLLDSMCYTFLVLYFSVFNLSNSFLKYLLSVPVILSFKLRYFFLTIFCNGIEKRKVHKNKWEVFETNWTDNTFFFHFGCSFRM